MIEDSNEKQPKHANNPSEKEILEQMHHVNSASNLFFTDFCCKNEPIKIITDDNICPVMYNLFQDTCFRCKYSKFVNEEPFSLSLTCTADTCDLQEVIASP